MKRKRSIVRSCFVLTMVLSFPVCGQASDLVKKVISFSGTPNARVFHENVEEMERLMPVVDGVTIYPVTDKGGVTTEALGRLFRADFHRLEDFDTGIDLMRTASTRLYRDNFLLVYLTSGVHSLEIPDWLDPEFEAVVNNWMVAAEYCKLAGMRGLLFDNEAYYGTNLWTYQNLKHKNSTTADEYRDLVFERGAQIMRAINTVYPDIAILCLYGPTQASLSGGRRAYNRFEMMRAFFDGLLSECTGAAAIIDGSERTYGYRDASQFERAAGTFRDARRHSRVPEKFDRHAQVAFPVFLGSAGFSSEDFGRNNYSPEELTAALRGALEHTDQYVWIYTENVSLWDRPGLAFLPDEYRDAMLAAHDPARNAPTSVAQSSPSVLPGKNVLEQNFPNPFNGTTIFRFSLPRPGKVELAVYDLAGRKVATLADMALPGGSHSVRWNGLDASGRELATGPYLYRLRVGEWQETRKLLLVR